MLSVLHISTSDSEGGSARSARRVHEGLRRLGHRSHMLVGTKASEDPDVDTVHGGGAGRVADRVIEETTKRAGLQYLWYPSRRRVLAHPWLREAGIVQLYNTHGGYFSHRLLPDLAQRARLVWRLSDMWAMTGHCAYAGPCERWRTGCGHCPDLATYPPLARDTTTLLWRIKRQVCATARPVVVAPSRWIEGLARTAPVFEGCRIVRITNGVDRSIFRPIPKQAAREILGLPPGETIILFAAHVLDGNERKGSGAAMTALRRLGARPGLRVALLGLGGESWEDAVPQPVSRLGFVRDERLLAAAYAAADIALAPAIVENLPNSILEAMACGVPAVAFDAGGIAELVRHGETGWLAAPGAPEGLVEGLDRLTSDGDLRARLGAAASAFIAEAHDASREVDAFARLYEELLEERRAA
ncbi:MAG: glycosyltransferase [Alphaproteobacteria bacterium]|nr:glycosyltransferase [Alphaproteobacteria bacterium]